MEPTHFDLLARVVSNRSRRRIVGALGGIAAALLAGTNAPEVEAGKGKKHKRKKRGKNKKGQPCSPDPNCGHEGICRNGVCFCPSHERFCGGTCCNPQIEVCVDNRECCHRAFACGSECCDGLCVDGACCPAERTCGSVCCPAGEVCSTMPGTHYATCCPAARVCPNAERPQESTCCAPNHTCCNGDCCAAGETCLPNAEFGERCCANPITVRGEECCPHGSGNSYFCGRFKCTYFLTGSGPGGCDLWCDSPEEGAYCGPGVPGVPTGEGNGRACCCNVPATATCVWP